MGREIVEREIGGRILRLETGDLAKQAAGSVLASYGDTVVLAAVVSGPAREGVDFFPLTVDYRERTYAAGKFPGGFFKREARPSQKEILTMRMIDRPIRPLFPKAFKDEVLIQAIVLATDQENEPDVVAMIGASAALAISPLPFEGPTGAVRVGYIDGKYVLNPTVMQMEYSTLELVLAGHRDGVNMIEVGAMELPEKVVTGAIEFGYRTVLEICEAIEELKAKAGKPVEWTPPPPTDDLLAELREKYKGRIREARSIAGKQERNTALRDLYDEVKQAYCPEEEQEPRYEWGTVRDLLDKIQAECMAEMIFHEDRRSDGRKKRELRPLRSEVAVLPRVHGSSLFQRGETQALCVVTLGTGRDEQIVDGLMEEYSKKFMLHYNFPPLCTGEVRRVGFTSRREIGHGNLAEKALEAVLPHPDKFPYTIRLVSEILESNGSSSMASACAGCLALMDAGVPIKQPVAGISIGMVELEGKRELLVDILGEEDHFGLMDFKITGTQRGVTAVQLDLKARSLSTAEMPAIFELARTARLDILRNMLQALPAPRSATSPHAPRIIRTQVAPDKIGRIIGPGGKYIKLIELETGATVEIEPDGAILVACMNMEGAEKALEMIEAAAAEVKVGKIYTGRVSSIKDFGAFIEIFPGQDGLCHISELDPGYVKNVEDILKVGDTVRVKVLSIDEQGRVKLSRKAALEEKDEEAEETEPVTAE
ncbi:MAG: polyribonucleotide nucleotidyltransferase [Planctomycetota bacterium]|nr:MAG: polyribonucleotide nucleotidyltransferase [Planctomycetota bacterium]